MMDWIEKHLLIGGVLICCIIAILLLAFVILGSSNRETGTRIIEGKVINIEYNEI